jgi:hypothetical protein
MTEALFRLFELSSFALFISQSIVHGMHVSPFFVSFIGFIRRSRLVLTHRVAFRISHTCSVVFAIMVFPQSVVAIAGVEVGSGKGGWHVLVLLCGLFLLHPACSAVISVWSNLKNTESASWQA